MPEIIGLVGFARTGKDTAAQTLIDQYGFERVSFADPIRNAIYTLNPYVTEAGLRIQNLVNMLGWDACKVQYAEVRRLLQVFGTEVAREQWSDSFWVDLGFSKMKPDGKYVITDVRFPNEAEAVRANGGRLWKIVRPGVGPVNAHASDSFIDQIECHTLIRNDGSISDLGANVRWAAALTLTA